MPFYNYEALSYACPPKYRIAPDQMQLVSKQVSIGCIIKSMQQMHVHSVIVKAIKLLLLSLMLILFH